MTINEPTNDPHADDPQEADDLVAARGQGQGEPQGW